MAHAHTQTDQRQDQDRNHLEDVRSLVLDTVQYVDDEALRSEMVAWIRRSYEQPADSLEEYVEHELASLESEHPMAVLDADGTADECFPEACEECEHYGAACPLFHDKTTQDALDLVAERTDDDASYAREMRDLARDFGCRRIPAFIDDFRGTDGDLVAEGHELLQQADLGTPTDADGDGLEPAVNPMEVVDVDDPTSRAGGDAA